jgi:hypothetical protein
VFGTVRIQTQRDIYCPVCKGLMNCNALTFRLGVAVCANCIDLGAKLGGEELTALVVASAKPGECTVVNGLHMWTPKEAPDVHDTGISEIDDEATSPKSRRKRAHTP